MRDVNGNLLSLGDEVVMCVNNYPYRGMIVAMNAHVTIETKGCQYGTKTT